VRLGRAAALLFLSLLLVAGAGAKPAHHLKKHHRVPVPAATGSTDALEPLPDLSKAMPLDQVGNLPSTAEQYRALEGEVRRESPAVADAQKRSAALRAEADALKQKLILTVARVQRLETEKVGLDAEIARLTALDQSLSASFAHDRVAVARLLAVLERLQHDMPPALVMRPDDALGAARGAMLIGASLPNVYDQAAALARRIALLKATRAELALRRDQGIRNSAELEGARNELDQLLAMKEVEADAAGGNYTDLKAKLDSVALRAGTLEALLEKVAALRQTPAPQSAVVDAGAPAEIGRPKAGRMLMPVVGSLVANGKETPDQPGLTFQTTPGAEVVAPNDGKILFAGPYHKSGHVLILETPTGYDAVLAGLDRVYVHPDDQVLAGEPIGVMPKTNAVEQLYFELRQNGRGIDPAPWLSLKLRKANRT
jgi:septal ring factor EnvC (AmiA/AmiB activator)